MNLVQEDIFLRENMWRVDRLFGALFDRIPDFADAEVIRSSGLVGLLNAYRTYDPNNRKGATFDTYSNSKIKYDMIDELRREGKARGNGARGKRRTAHIPFHFFGEYSEENWDIKKEDIEKLSHDGVVDRVIGKEERAILAQELEKLPAELKRDIEMYYWECMTLKEIAEAEGVSEMAISYRLEKARKMLKNRLK